MGGVSKRANPNPYFFWLSSRLFLTQFYIQLFIQPFYLSTTFQGRQLSTEQLTCSFYRWPCSSGWSWLWDSQGKHGTSGQFDARGSGLQWCLDREAWWYHEETRCRISKIYPKTGKFVNTHSNNSQHLNFNFKMLYCLALHGLHIRNIIFES